MYELIILGVLLEQECHGYQLKQFADNLLTGIFEISYGALYPKFKKLEERNLITSHSNITDGGQEKIFYQITEDGMEHFKVLMREMPKETFQMKWLHFRIKVLFFNFIDRELQIELMNNIVEDFEKHSKKARSILDSSKNLDMYQQSLITHNLNTMQNYINWVKSL